MEAPEERTHRDASPASTRRRARLLAAAGVVVAVAAAAGIAYAVRSTKPDLKVPEVALTGGRSPGRLVSVRGHSKMQAYGRNWSLHRPIDIAPHFRAAA
jgi:cytochrome c-type biogenesis protein CcmE